jgi:predicted Mrr-cat superfamily restriction endonuclease
MPSAGLPARSSPRWLAPEVRVVMWVVKGGQHGERDREEYNLVNGVATLGWAQLPDLACVDTEVAARDIIRCHAPAGSTERRIQTWGTVIRAFATQIEVGHLIAMPRKGRGLVVFGDVIEAYHYNAALATNEDRFAGPHTIAVRWAVPIAVDDLGRLDGWLPRSLRGGLQTVYHLNPQDMEERIRSELVVFSPRPGSAP